MFETIEDAAIFYLDNKDDIHVNKIIYENFNNNAEQYKILVESFNNLPGYGELAFNWNWNLLVKEAPNDFKFLEIGVYKGRVLSTIGLLANEYNKKCNIFGITPLSTVGDKYSDYENSNYLNDIQNNYLKYNNNLDNLNIIHGFSQSENIIKIAEDNGQYDIIFIDGSHNYDDVVLDIQNYSKLLKKDGYLIMDDSSLNIKNPYGLFLGYPDVANAINDCLDNNEEFVYLYAIGHNRLWKKIN